MILTSIITSVFTTFLLSRVYLNLQYLHSNAGQRQSQIIKATRSVFEQQLTDEDRYSLSKVYHTSLGPLFYRLYTFEQDAAGATLPCLNGMGKEGWHFYDQYIRPVRNDMNNNSFIGWLPYFANVERLKVIWKMCQRTEELITQVELLKMEGKVSITGNQLLISSSAKEDPEVRRLVLGYEDLYALTKKWCRMTKVTIEKPIGLNLKKTGYGN